MYGEGRGRKFLIVFICNDLVSVIFIIIIMDISLIIPTLSGTYCHTFGDIDLSLYKKIAKVLDLESELSDEERERELKQLLIQIVPKKNPINTEKELKDFLLKEQLNLSIDVMDYLKIKLTKKGYEDAEQVHGVGSDHI